MKTKIILSFIVIGLLQAQSIQTEEGYSNSSSKTFSKNKEKTFSKNKEKTKSLEKGKEKTNNFSSSRENSFENSFSNENSFSFSKNQVAKSTISISPTQLMPEIDYLVDKSLKKMIKSDQYFIKNLIISRDDLPAGSTRLPMFVQFHPRVVFKAERFLIKYLSAQYQQKLMNYLSNYNTNYSIQIGATAGLRNVSVDDANALSSGTSDYDFTLSADYFIIFGGDMQGKLVISFNGALLTPIFLKIPKYNMFIELDPNQNIFQVVYKNRKIVYLSSSKIAHFYGDLNFIEDFDNNNILVVDQKIGANGFYLNEKNSHLKFDFYFKKLIKLYLEAFQHLKNKNYSTEEVKYLVRKYIYKKITHKNDFFEKYLNDPTDFWRPKKMDLISYPVANTSNNDIIFDKKDGIILNKKLMITIEKSSSIDMRFNQLMRNQKTSRFANIISKTVNYFERHNRQEMARLTKSLAVKIANNNDFAKKQDLVNKATTSTDVLNTLLNFLK